MAERSLDGFCCRTVEPQEKFKCCLRVCLRAGGERRKGVGREVGSTGRGNGRVSDDGCLVGRPGARSQIAPHPAGPTDRHHHLFKILFMVMAFNTILALSACSLLRSRRGRAGEAEEGLWGSARTAQGKQLDTENKIRRTMTGGGAGQAERQGVNHCKISVEKEERRRTLRSNLLVELLGGEETERNGGLLEGGALLVSLQRLRRWPGRQRFAQDGSALQSDAPS